MFLSHQIIITWKEKTIISFLCNRGIFWVLLSFQEQYYFRLWKTQNIENDKYLYCKNSFEMMQQCQFPDSDGSNIKLYWGIKELQSFWWDRYWKRLIAMQSGCRVKRLATLLEPGLIFKWFPKVTWDAVCHSEVTTVSDRNFTGRW